MTRLFFYLKITFAADCCESYAAIDCCGSRRGEELVIRDFEFFCPWARIRWESETEWAGRGVVHTPLFTVVEVVLPFIVPFTIVEEEDKRRTSFAWGESFFLFLFFSHKYIWPVGMCACYRFYRFRVLWNFLIIY